MTRWALSDFVEVWSVGLISDEALITAARERAPARRITMATKDKGKGKGKGQTSGSGKGKGKGKGAGC